MDVGYNCTVSIFVSWNRKSSLKVTVPYIYAQSNYAENRNSENGSLLGYCAM